MLFTHEAIGKGSWPKLERSNLDNNQLDEAAMTALSQGKWPLLKSLDFSSHPSLNSAAIAQTAYWASLSKLSLAFIQLDSSCTHSIAVLHNQLQDLNLDFTDLDAAALSQLTAQPWPQLQSLTVMANRLTADAIASLALAEVPNLATLDLSNNQLNATAARHLATGNWLKLSCLDLKETQLGDDAMAFLAKGRWLTLSTLTLYGNDLSLLGLELLLVGQWPLPDSLTLDCRNATAAIWTLLHLCVEAMPSDEKAPGCLWPGGLCPKSLYNMLFGPA